MIELAYIIVIGFVVLVAGACALFSAGEDMKPATPKNPLCDLMDGVTEGAVKFHEKYQK
jgi:hypothetical protein